MTNPLNPPLSGVSHLLHSSCTQVPNEGTEEHRTRCWVRFFIRIWCSLKGLCHLTLFRAACPEWSAAAHAQQGYVGGLVRRQTAGHFRGDCPRSVRVPAAGPPSISKLSPILRIGDNLLKWHNPFNSWRPNTEDDLEFKETLQPGAENCSVSQSIQGMLPSIYFTPDITSWLISSSVRAEDVKSNQGARFGEK